MLNAKYLTLIFPEIFGVFKSLPYLCIVKLIKQTPLTTTNMETSEKIILSDEDLMLFKNYYYWVKTCKSITLLSYLGDEIKEHKLSHQKLTAMRKKKFEMPSKELVDFYMPYSSDVFHATLFAFYGIGLTMPNKDYSLQINWK